MMHAVELCLIGFLVGTIGTLAGVGGGVFLLPLLFLLYHLSPQETIGTSLAAVFFNTLSGTIAYYRQKRILYNIGFPIALMTIPGAIIGSRLADLFNPTAFRIVIGGVLILISLYLIIKTFRNNFYTADLTTIPHYFTSRRLFWVYLISFGVGVFSSFLGLGGGVIHIPLMIYFLNLPVHIATATSHFILVITSFTGSLTHLGLGNIRLDYVLMLGGGAILGAQVGSFLSRKIKARWIIMLFALILTFTGIRLVIRIN